MKFTYKLLIVLLFLSPCLSSAQTTIEMEEINGVYYVPCEVNGIPMKFIFDTGASNVSISKTEAEFLIKQGLLAKEDFIEVVNYRIADGSIKEGIKVKLKEIKIQEIILRDITATIVSESSAPLLLGQSVLSKFGRFEVEGNILRINSNNQKTDLTNTDRNLAKNKGQNQEVDNRNGFKNLKLGTSIMQFENLDVINKTKFQTSASWMPSKGSELNYLFDNKIDLFTLVFDREDKLSQIKLSLFKQVKPNDHSMANQFKLIERKLSSVLGKPSSMPEELLKTLKNKIYINLMWKGEKVAMFLYFENGA